MKRTKQTKLQWKHSSGGFTLVEMLVSVTLVLLMMTLFTSIFQMATDSMSTQQGIAKNDQKARALTTTMLGDISKRSYRFGQPYYPTEQVATSPTEFGNRAGYIYISTNDPDSWQDDILQFTVDVSQTQENPDDTPYFGAAKLLYDLTSDPAFSDGPRRTTLLFDANQPDADDANLFANEVASSSAAEISYFIRNGNLYRRVMLLREPLPVAGEELAIQPASNVSVFGAKQFIQGTAAGGAFAYVSNPLSIEQNDPGLLNHFFLAAGDSAPSAWAVTASNDFWRHFDMSATPFPVGAAIPTNATLVGIDALDNSNLLAAPGGAIALGDPRFRFGFNAVTGLSREHDNPTDLLFIGRFTQAETSNHRFNWPIGISRSDEVDESIGNVSTNAGTSLANINVGSDLLGDDGAGNDGNGNPMDLAGTHLHLDIENGVISELQGATGRGGNRAVEDLLLPNVHGFRVEIWDERLQRYVTPSNGNLTQLLAGGTQRIVSGDFHASRRLNATYGPRGAGAPASNHVFDTWNPTVGGAAAPVSPPFIPYRYYPPRSTDAAVPAGDPYAAPSGPGPSPASMANPYGEYDVERRTNQENKGFWVASDHITDPVNPVIHDYVVGDVVFAVPDQYAAAGIAGWDADGDGNFEWSTAVGGDQDNTLTINGSPNAGFPVQGFQIAYRCIQPGTSSDRPPTWPREPGQRFTENNGVGGTAVWESFDNRRPLRSLRVTVQFYENKTEKLRQLSLVLPLTTDR